jgi:predicted acyltransferase
MVDLTRNADQQRFWRKSHASAMPYARVSHTVRTTYHSAQERPKALAAANARVGSIDALRGFAMFWILAGDAFAWALHDMTAGKEGPLVAVVQFVSEQFKHAAWEGLNFYDFLFPLFIFVIGVSIVYSLSRLVEREGRAAAYRRVLVRAALLFALGLIYYGGMSKLWPEIRLLGVLQRIALCYLFASLLFLTLDVRGLLGALATLLVGYWALMTFLPVPGAGSFTEDANVARWIDAQYLPGLRLYGDWDPEGLLSTLPSIATCLVGVLAGLVLKDACREPMHKALLLAGTGLLMVVTGHAWAAEFPIVKMIWTSSFVLVTGGYSLLLLASFYVLVDIWGHKAWTTMFLWVGANAITLYMLNNLIDLNALARKLVGGDVERLLDETFAKGTGSLLAVTLALAMAVTLARYLYRRQIFLRV